MIRSWLAYLSLLLLDALLWVSVDGYIYYLLLRVLLMLPILNLLLFLVGNRLIQIHVEPYAEGGKLRISSALPLLFCSRIHVNGLWHNGFYETSESVTTDLKHNTKRLQAPDMGSGQYHLQLNKLQTRDLLGLYRRTTKLHEETKIFRFPQPVPVTDAVYQKVAKEARQRPAGMPGSDYELKEHQEGEPLRHIHYKASYRLKKTMIREFQKEEASSLHLHLCFPQDIAACERLLSVSCGFCLKVNAQNSLYISWQAADGFRQIELRTVQDMDSFLRKLLAMPRVCEGTSDFADGLCLNETLVSLMVKENSV